MEDLMDKKDDKDINYSNLTMEALRDVVYKVLKITEKKGLLENHHFSTISTTKHNNFCAVITTTTSSSGATGTTYTTRY